MVHKIRSTMRVMQLQATLLLQLFHILCARFCAACGNAMCFIMQVAVLLAIKFHALAVAFINILYKLKHAEISVLQKPAVIISREK